MHTVTQQATEQESFGMTPFKKIFSPFLGSPHCQGMIPAFQRK